MSEPKSRIISIEFQMRSGSKIQAEEITTTAEVWEMFVTNLTNPNVPSLVTPKSKD